MRSALCTWRTSPDKATAGISRRVELRCSLLTGFCWGGRKGEDGEREQKFPAPRKPEQWKPHAALAAALPPAGPENDGRHRDIAQPSRGRGHIPWLSCCHPTRVCRDETGRYPLPCQGYKMPVKRHDSLWQCYLLSKRADGLALPLVHHNRVNQVASLEDALRFPRGLELPVAAKPQVAPCSAQTPDPPTWTRAVVWSPKQ